MDQSSYQVEVTVFAQSHYIKKFAKNYPGKWAITEEAIIDQCKLIDNLLQMSRADLISYIDNQQVVKLDFSIAGSKVSPRKSGNRCILFVDNSLRHVDVLLVYSKNDVKSNNETQWWKLVLKKEFSGIAKKFSF
jgi:hypothetical protein